MAMQATVIYDSDCGFCRFTLALLLSWDRQSRALRPLPLGTEEADRLLADLTAEQRDASWHVVFGDAERGPSDTVTGDGFVRRSAGAALAPTLHLLPGGRLPAALFAHFPGATERGYRWVADHRGIFGRCIPLRARRWADRVIARSPYP